DFLDHPARRVLVAPFCDAFNPGFYRCEVVQYAVSLQSQPDEVTASEKLRDGFIQQPHEISLDLRIVGVCPPSTAKTSLASFVGELRPWRRVQGRKAVNLPPFEKPGSPRVLSQLFCFGTQWVAPSDARSSVINDLGETAEGKEISVELLILPHWLDPFGDFSRNRQSLQGKIRLGIETMKLLLEINGAGLFGFQ